MRASSHAGMAAPVDGGWGEPPRSEDAAGVAHGGNCRTEQDGIGEVFIAGASLLLIGEEVFIPLRGKGPEGNDEGGPCDWLPWNRGEGDGKGKGKAEGEEIPQRMCQRVRR